MLPARRAPVPLCLGRAAARRVHASDVNSSLGVAPRHVEVAAARGAICRLVRDLRRGLIARRAGARGYVQRDQLLRQAALLTRAQRCQRPQRRRVWLWRVVRIHAAVLLRAQPSGRSSGTRHSGNGVSARRGLRRSGLGARPASAPPAASAQHDGTASDCATGGATAGSTGGATAGSAGGARQGLASKPPRPAIRRA